MNDAQQMQQVLLSDVAQTVVYSVIGVIGIIVVAIAVYIIRSNKRQ